MPSILTPFRITDSGKVGETTNPERMAQQKIIDVLVTGKGSRAMRPTYGAGAMDLLFEPVDDLLYGEFRVDAIGEVSQNVSGVSIEDIIVSPADQFLTDDYETTLNVAVRYRVGPLNRSTFTFSLGDPSGLTQESPL